MPAGDQDHLSQRNFQRLATFIEGYSGIKMPSTKVTMIEGRLRFPGPIEQRECFQTVRPSHAA